MVHINIRILFGLLLLVANITELRAETIKLDKSQFSESYAESVKISGSVRAGVMYASDLPRVLTNALYITVDEKSEKMLCVKILSVDGRYGADITYELTSAFDGSDPFELPTGHRDIVTSYTPDQITVLAELKPDCNGRGGRIVPAAWGIPNRDVVKVFLNSSASKTYLRLEKLNQSKKFEKVLCYPVKSENSTAYNTECEINNISSFDLTKTKILRSNFGSISKPISLKVYLPQSKL